MYSSLTLNYTSSEVIKRIINHNKHSMILMNLKLFTSKEGYLLHILRTMYYTGGGISLSLEV